MYRNKNTFIYALFVIILNIAFSTCKINLKLTRVWGPGLQPHKIIMPARYFFIQAVDDANNSITSSVGLTFKAYLEGRTKLDKECRIWMNYLDRKDGSFIIRYKVYEECSNLKISILFENNHVAESPYLINSPVYPETCSCPVDDVTQFIQSWECGEVPNQIKNDIRSFSNIDWDKLRKKVISTYDKPYSVSLCHYVIKNNEIYRKCYGKYVGFKMFTDSILLSLSRKSILPDVEFFINLGDWPLVTEDHEEKYPIFSWCGSTDSFDIVLPTYDISESTLENMGRVMLDMLSVQGSIQGTWETRIPKAFWRGRDSSRERLDLIDIARRYPDLFNVSLTNFFFFRDEEKIYGPKTDHVSFFRFFDYKFQLGLDGTVAAYRLPYLLGGGSLLLKQESKYYEHFYKDLVPYKHYIPVARNLSDLIDKLQWAIENDDKAAEIARNGQTFANEYLLPKNIFCYYAHVINEFSEKITSSIHILEDMEKVEQDKLENCDCKKIKDEL